MKRALVLVFGLAMAFGSTAHAGRSKKPHPKRARYAAASSATMTQTVSPRIDVSGDEDDPLAGIPPRKKKPHKKH